ncbi:MAG TPA: GAF domain-containing protein [Anaerolineaceae bacterium]|jgi:signal transduction histidine kinase|nr:GAF domain-containing protein [Anaerolineaceae bacterium]
MTESRPTVSYGLFSKQPLRTWLPQLITFGYLLIVAATFVLTPILASRWLNVPFLGGFVEQSMVFNGTRPADPASNWSAVDQNLLFGNRLQKVEGQPVENAAQLRDILMQHSYGDTITITVETPEFVVKDYQITLIRFPFNDRMTFFYLLYLIGLVYLGAAVWIFALRRNDSSARAFALFASSLAMGISTIYDLSTSHVLSPLWILGLTIAGGGLFHLAFLFPSQADINRKIPWLRYLGYFIAIALAVYAWIQMYATSDPRIYAKAWSYAYAFAGACIAFALGWFTLRYFRSESPLERDQIRWVLLGSVFSFLPAALWLIATPFLGDDLHFSPYLVLPLIIFPLAGGYAIQRHRLLYTDYVFSRALLYGAMAILVAVGYALLVSGLSLGLGTLLAPNMPVFLGLTFFILALLILPLRQGLQNLIDRLFFRGSRAYQESLKTFSGDLTQAVDLNDIVRVLRRYVERSLQPGHLHIFLFDPLNEQYGPAPDLAGKPTTDLRFSPVSRLVQALGDQHTPLYLGSTMDFPAALQPEQARIHLLNAILFIPLPGRQRLAGWLALGPRQSGEPYTSRELSFLEALSDQSALAIERAQVVDNLQRRVQEMNVLTRVAQGVNITITLDDIYELTYAQTTQIIPADEFRLMLTDPESKALIQVFFVKDDERLSHQENIVIPPGQTLEQEVIRQRRSTVTDDYNKECQRRGVVLPQSDMFAWMCVPLNTGAETIGALSLGNRDPNVTYTQEQLNLLQAAADQVAGAITKARLLGETERRARQLSTLNDVTRQLTSTLETEPLLQTILQNAVEILGCEAGSLLLVDPQTDELVFRVVSGPVAGDLLNKRLPPGSGVVGKAVRSKAPVIVNDTRTSADWASDPDKQTGFKSQSLLAVPLIVKETVIGVLEVINHLDGSSFGRDDQDLLTAFAAQAAIAIENARLYTLTDQALAARVEELSVMQRIDRELNTTLDTARAMRITLEWALRQSGVTAGLVGLISPEGLQIVTSQGYTSELTPYEQEYVPLKAYALVEIVADGQPQRRILADNQRGFLTNVRSQAVFPIRREGATNGLIILESTDETSVSDEALNFLLRLLDHASIAIANAQLYAAVQAANVAKSEFVSFVAHELKNPMTSIKGYTELLAVGAVGPITEPQANFLATIRTNIDRMNTLVSDLNDLSKIEAGRMRLDFKATPVPDLVEEVLRSLRKQIEEKEQTLHVELPENLPQLWCDRSRVVQVLVNLVSNAHKYTEKGGEIFVGAERCANQWDPEGVAEVVHIWVRDSGIGITPEDQAKIFQKFFRSEDPKTREVPGTGLGLNITRSLVEMQGGRIWFESEFRKGTTFHFTVPIAEE